MMYPVFCEYTNSRSVSFTVTLRVGSSNVITASGLDLAAQMHFTVSRAAVHLESGRIRGATGKRKTDGQTLRCSHGPVQLRLAILCSLCGIHEWPTYGPPGVAGLQPPSALVQWISDFGLSFWGVLDLNPQMPPTNWTVMKNNGSYS